MDSTAVESGSRRRWSTGRAFGRLSSAVLLGAMLALSASPASPASAASASAASGALVPGGRCEAIGVTIRFLPPKVPARVVLAGPSGYRHAFPSSGGVCLAPGRYVLVSQPVRVGPARVAYPTGGKGPLPFARSPFVVPSPPPLLPEIFNVNYFDEAPLTTLVLPRGAIEIPRGREHPAAGGFVLAHTALTSRIRPGDIVVSPAASGLPDGLLGVVVSARALLRTVSLVTQPVSPVRAFSQVDLALSTSATSPTTLNLGGLGPAAPAGGRLRPSQGASFGCGQSFTVSGSLSLQPSATVDLGWSWGPAYAPWEVEVHGGFSLDPNATVSATVSANAGVHCQVSVPLGAPIPIGPPGGICTDFGCITPQVVTTASLSGTIGENFSQTLDEAVTGGAGASFRFGARGNSLTTTNTIALSGSSSATSSPWQGSVTLGVGPALQVLYGIPDVAGIGPEVGVQDQVSLSGNSTGWSADDEVAGFAGVVASAFGFSYSDTVDFPVAGPYPLCSTGCSGSWPTAPSPPLGVTATPDASNPQNTVDVSWVPPVWPGTCGGLTGYTVSAGSTTQSAGPSATSAVVSGLTAATTYPVTVAADAGSCGSTASAAVDVTTANPNPPTAPCITSAYGGENAYGPDGGLTFLPPASSGPCSTGGTGGSPVTSYTIEWAGDGTTGSYTATASSDPGCFAGICSFPLPAYGATYSVTVSATNSAGSGPASSPWTLVPLGRPTTPTVTSVTGGETVIGGYNGPGATITWSPPTSDGGSPVTSYTIVCTQGCIGTTVSQPASAGTTAVVRVASYGTTYGFCVGATNSVGYSGCSASVSVVPLTEPTAPVITSASGASGTPSLTVAWNPPGSDGGSSVTGYLVDWAGNGTWGEAVEPGSATTATVALPAFGSYSVTVAAVNAVGQGPWSTSSTVTTAAAVPGPPTITSTAGGGVCEQQLHGSVSWTPPGSDGGSPITSYTLAWSGPGSGSLTQPASSGTSATFLLPSIGSYSVTVSATNAVGTGAASGPATLKVKCIHPPP